MIFKTEHTDLLDSATNAVMSQHDAQKCSDTANAVMSQHVAQKSAAASLSHNYYRYL